MVSLLLDSGARFTVTAPMEEMETLTRHAQTGWDGWVEFTAVAPDESTAPVYIRISAVAAFEPASDDTP